MKAKYKITFDVEKRLKELAVELPEVPHFVINSSGQYELQKMTRSKMVSGQELLDKDSKTIVNGEYVSDLSNYLQQGYQVRMMNHIVNLRNEYGKYETAGVVEYMRRVNELHITIQQIKAEYKEPTRWEKFVAWLKSFSLQTVKLKFQQ